MRPIELVRGFFVDLWHLPLVFKLFALWVAFSSVRERNRRRDHLRLVRESEQWPSYRARVVWAQVGPKKTDGRHQPSYREGLVTYSYTVPGSEVEVGEYCRKFYVEDEADEWARGLRDTSIEVKVDPKDNSRSWWPHDSKKVPTSTAATVAVDRSWGWRQTVALAIFLISGAGAFYAIFLQVMLFQGRDTAAASRNLGFWTPFIGAILCGLAASTLRNGKGFWTGQSSDNALSLDGPLLKALGWYAGVMVVYGVVRGFAHQENGQIWSTLVFSSVWMLFYASSAVESWWVMRGAPPRSVENAQYW